VQVPFGRLVEPSDIAALTAFMLSSESGVMTGSVRAHSWRAARVRESPSARSSGASQLTRCAAPSLWLALRAQVVDFDQQVVGAYD
jgi:hypothetical protein